MELKPMVCLVVLQGAQPKCKFQNKCLLVKGAHAKRICRSCRFTKCKEIGMNKQALHPCRDLIGRRQTSQSDSISPSDSPSSSSSSGGKLPPASEEALCFLYGLRDMDAQVRRNYAARRGHCVVGPDQDRFFYNPICDFSGVAPNDDLSQSIRGDIAIAAEWAEQVPSFHLLSPALRASFLGFKKVVFDPTIESSSLQKFFHYSDSAILAKVRAVRHLLRRFCLMFVIIEHGLFTAQMPVHDNVWFLTDRTCLVRDVEAIPEEIKLHLTSKTTMAQQLLYPLTSLLIDEIAQPLRRLRPTPEEVSALKVLMLMKPTIIRESESVPLASSEELRLLSSVRDKVLTGLHAYYFVSGEENPEERLSDLLMLSGGVAKVFYYLNIEESSPLFKYLIGKDERKKLMFAHGSCPHATISSGGGSDGYLCRSRIGRSALVTIFRYGSIRRRMYKVIIWWLKPVLKWKMFSFLHKTYPSSHQENDEDENDDDGDDGGKYDDYDGDFGGDEDDDNDNDNENDNDNDNNNVGFRISLF
ncbi:unnamed protein product [Angiostrongylus costaricensis]|uniref:Nuclear receptor domain-containing protein n=1 Tax=Angiostrongylus costaricensis TaxID=334426 RepID=A0A0R3PRY6_ANGCS|nr:unnamed protein product [Angiostrongylus costaricensis]